jgi:hypothetical protein
MVQKDEKYFLLLTLFFKDSKEEKKIEMRLEEFAAMIHHMLHDGALILNECK